MKIVCGLFLVIALVAAPVAAQISYLTAAGQTIFVSSDFTTANSVQFQNITGLTFTMAANKAQNVPIHCVLAYSQATAAVSDSFGFSIGVVAPTSMQIFGAMWTAASTVSYGQAVISTATSAAAVTATPSAITTIWIAQMDALVEVPSNASQMTITAVVKTTTGANAITVKRGSYCVLF